MHTQIVRRLARLLFAVIGLAAASGCWGWHRDYDDRRGERRDEHRDEHRDDRP